MSKAGGETTEPFLVAAEEAARAAGALIVENWQRFKEIEYKSAIDIVTEVDRKAEEKIVGILLQRFPDHAILAEEETRISGSAGEYRWIIDPLDGTTNFAHGYPQVSVSIALEKAQRILLGVVFDPLRQELFTAAEGRGAFLNDSPIRTSKTAELDKALLATGFPYDRRERADFYLNFFKAFLVRCQGIRRAGSAALDLCYLACGRIDGFWELKLHAWDTAAASVIVREAGGNLTDFNGNAFTIWGEETLGSNGLIHAEMLEVLAQIKSSASP
ncbi:MAG: inositol monophosphatase [Deltaproteobacteria bacterium]|nr:inositol monophosphatase [Deltaproteobacteria bacterium]